MCSSEVRTYCWESWKHFNKLCNKLTHPLRCNLLCWRQIPTCSRDVNIFACPVSEPMVLPSVSHLLKQELQQKEQQWRRRCEELQVQVQQLQEDREELQSRLKGSHAQGGMSVHSEMKCKLCYGVVEIWSVFASESLPKEHVIPNTAFLCCTLHTFYSSDMTVPKMEVLQYWTKTKGNYGDYFLLWELSSLCYFRWL